MKYAAALILGESEWEIVCPLGDYDSVRSAQHVLDNATAIFANEEDGPRMRVDLNDQTLFFADDHLSITEISADAKTRLGPPLDMRIPGNVEVASAALRNEDASYVVEPADMIPSGKRLQDFLERYGHGYKPDHIANQILPADRIPRVPGEGAASHCVEDVTA